MRSFKKTLNKWDVSITGDELDGCQWTFFNVRRRKKTTESDPFLVVVCTVRQTHWGLRIFAGCASCARVLEYSLLLNGVFGAYWVGWHAAMATTTIPKVFTTFPLPLQHYSPSVLRCVSTRSHIRVPQLSQSGSSLVKNPHYKNPEPCVPKQNLENGCRLPPQ